MSVILQLTARFTRMNPISMRKPFDVLAEGLISEKSRGDRTSIELFCAGIAEWPIEARQLLA